MRPFLAALVISWFVADVTMLAFPYGSTMPQPVRVVYLCCMPAKDQARLPQEDTPFGALALKPLAVKTEQIVAASMTPFAQAAETRTKKRAAKR